MNFSVKLCPKYLKANFFYIKNHHWFGCISPLRFHLILPLKIEVNTNCDDCFTAADIQLNCCLADICLCMQEQHCKLQQKLPRLLWPLQLWGGRLQLIRGSTYLVLTILLLGQLCHLMTFHTINAYVNLSMLQTVRDCERYSLVNLAYD